MGARAGPVFRKTGSFHQMGWQARKPRRKPLALRPVRKSFSERDLGREKSWRKTGRNGRISMRMKRNLPEIRKSSRNPEIACGEGESVFWN